MLYADVVAAGGTQRDRKSPITLIIGGWITYSGGAIVNVALVHSKDAEFVPADTLRSGLNWPISARQRKANKLRTQTQLKTNQVFAIRKNALVAVAKTDQESLSAAKNRSVIFPF